MTGIRSNEPFSGKKEGVKAVGYVYSQAIGTDKGEPGRTGQVHQPFLQIQATDFCKTTRNDGRPPHPAPNAAFKDSGDVFGPNGNDRQVDGYRNFRYVAVDPVVMKHAATRIHRIHFDGIPQVQFVVDHIGRVAITGQ